MYIAREGGRITLHMAGRPAPWSSTLGEWVTLAFHHNAGDGQTRTFNAGELVEMFTAVPTGDIAFGTIEWQRTGTMDVSTLPCGRTSCRIRGDVLMGGRTQRP
jgi:hypothetical protein